MATPAKAGDLAAFNAAVEAAQAHNRVAIGYLGTGNMDLASIEIDRLREAWRALGQHFSGKRPEMFEDNPYYVVAMTDIGTRLITADLMLHSGHPDVARQSLLAVRNDLYKLRKSAGIVVLADCIYDANRAMDGLIGYNKHDLDWTKPETRFDIANKASVYGYVLDRCDEMAGETLRKVAEFRRLVDGAKAGLALIPKAIATRDSDLLHRILIELRSFDNLLAFRYG
ncbi:MAG: hypothetical protein ACREQD_12120 [Candidatus Binataceae bacterium]